MTYGPDKIRARISAILLATALATSFLAAGSFWVQRMITGDKVLSGKVLPDFAADMPQVRTITITTRTGTYNLVRKGADWVMPERGDYPVAPETLAALAKGLSDLSYKVARTSDPSQFVRLGVDDPGPDSDGVLVSLKNASNQILDSLHIGSKGEALFVRKAGSNDVFEANGKLPDFTSPMHWLDLKVIDVTPETIASVTGQRAGQTVYEIVRRPDGGFAPVGGIANVTATTAAIALSKWAPLDVMSASRLTSDPIATHATNLRDGTIVTATAYKENGRNWVVIFAAASSDTPDVRAAKLNQRTDGWAFELSPTDFADISFSKDAVLNGPSPAPQ